MPLSLCCSSGGTAAQTKPTFHIVREAKFSTSRLALLLLHVPVRLANHMVLSSRWQGHHKMFVLFGGEVGQSAWDALLLKKFRRSRREKKKEGKTEGKKGRGK